MSRSNSKPTRRPAAKEATAGATSWTVLSDDDQRRLGSASKKLSSVAALTRVLLFHSDSRGETAPAAETDREEVLHCIGDLAEEAWKLVADVYDPENRDVP